MLRKAVNVLPDIFFIYDIAAERFLYWNDTTTEATGFSDEEIVHMAPIDFFRDTDVKRFQRAIHETEKTGESTIDVCLYHKDGSSHPYEFSTARLTPFNSEKQIICGVGRDIQSRIEAEQALFESEERYRLTMESSLVGIGIIQDLGFKYVNPMMCELFGYDREEMLDDLHVPDLVVPEQRDRLKSNLVMRSRGAKTEPYELTFVRKDGTRFFALVNGAHVDYEGKPASIGVVMDITSYKNAELERQKAHSYLDSVLEGIIVTDTRGVISFVNSAFSRMTGYAAYEVIGKTPSVLKSGRHDQAFYQDMWSSIKETGQWRGEIWNRSKDMSDFPCLMHISAVKDASGKVTSYIGVFSDITSIKESEQKLNYLAHHDPLTDLPNRLLFSARLEHTIERQRRNKRYAALLMVDVDSMNNINNAFGHAMGDHILKLVADRLRDTVRKEDTVARLGGDEFGVIIEDLGETQHAGRIADKLIRLISIPIVVDSHTLIVKSNIGISTYPRDGGSRDTLEKGAASALARAKKRGANQYEFSEPSLAKVARKKLHLESELYKAIGSKQLAVHYQPQVDLRSCRVAGFEALMRWHHPTLGDIPPKDFIPVAEEAGLIDAIGEFVLNTAAKDLKTFQTLSETPLRVAINIATRQLHAQQTLSEMVQDIITRYQLNPDQLELEITESAFESYGEVKSAIDAIERLGIRFSIDDFGTGYSSLRRLQRLPVRRIKIDQGFVMGIPSNKDNIAISTAIIAMAHSLSMEVVAEGVETRAQLDFLRNQGCDEVQGFLISRPVPASEVAATIENAPLVCAD
ncbi:MAG: EAL domain-containing protein [Gammaproteobacteria bacterium]